VTKNADGVWEKVLEALKLGFDVEIKIIRARGGKGGNLLLPEAWPQDLRQQQDDRKRQRAALVARMDEARKAGANVAPQPNAFDGDEGDEGRSDVSPSAAPATGSIRTVEAYTLACLKIAKQRGIDVGEHQKVPAVWEDWFNDGMAPDDAVDAFQFEENQIG
jgi:hypothetical protein